MFQSKKLGVLLVNTGSPEAPTPDAVRVYLRRFLTDPHIAPMPLPFWKIILRLFILGKRSEASARKYANIWTDGGSPLDVIEHSLAHRLSERLKPENIIVTSAMSYSSPFIAESLQNLLTQHCDSLMVIPLYPQSAYSTVGAVRDQVEAAQRDLPITVPLTFIDHYYDRPRYIEAIASIVRNSDFDLADTDRLICSYHSIPLKDVEAGDTYVAQTEATTKALINTLGIDPERVVALYQSRFDSARTWQGPFLRQTLDEWARKADDERLFIICPNFSIDCLETLNEIKNEIIPAYESSQVQAKGSATVTYLPCLNDSPDGVEVIEDVINAHRS